MIFNDIPEFIAHVEQKLYQAAQKKALFPRPTQNMFRQSAVLLPLGPWCSGYDHPEDPCIILNKRSEKVKQSGDLCCPGGGVTPFVDGLLARLLALPLSPLSRWTFWRDCRTRHRESAKKLSLLYATSLRESFEEMRLNPLGVRFLGPLPPQNLRARERYIFPMAGWVPRQKRFVPNWEVDKIVHIPVRNLLNTKNYSVFRLHANGTHNENLRDLAPCYPCYKHEANGETDILWGATFRIVMDFMHTVFDFSPPNTRSMTAFDWWLSETYFVS